MKELMCAQLQEEELIWTTTHCSGSKSESERTTYISEKNKQVQPPVGDVENLEGAVGVRSRKREAIDAYRTLVGSKSSLYPSV